MALLNSTASLICRICTRAATRLLVGRQGRLDQRACGDCGSHLELAGFLTVGTGRTAHPHHAVAAWLRLCRERNIDERRCDRAITGPVIGLQTGYGEANTNQCRRGVTGRPPREARRLSRRPGAQKQTARGPQQKTVRHSAVQPPVPIIDEVSAYMHGAQKYP